MKVKRLGWLGTRTSEFKATATFFREVLGLSMMDEDADFAMFALPGGTRDFVEVIGPNAEDSELESTYYTTGPVVGFVVDDIVAARQELASKGVERIEDIFWSSQTPGYGWFHFRGPDGNVYGMLQGTRSVAEVEPTEVG